MDGRAAGDRRPLTSTSRVVMSSCVVSLVEHVHLALEDRLASRHACRRRGHEQEDARPPGVARLLR